jgi:hypothetical protein
MKTIQIILLVLIIIGIALLSTQKLWVPDLVSWIINQETSEPQAEEILPSDVKIEKKHGDSESQTQEILPMTIKVESVYTRDNHVFVNFRAVSFVNSTKSPGVTELNYSEPITAQLADMVSMSISQKPMTIEDVKNYSYESYSYFEAHSEEVLPINVQEYSEFILEYINKNLANPTNSGLFTVTLEGDFITSMDNNAYAN